MYIPARIGLRCCNIGGRGSDAVFDQSATGAAPKSEKRLFRIELDVLATEFSLIGIGCSIGSLATESVFVGVDGTLRRARAGALSEREWGRHGNQKKQKGSQQLHKTVHNAGKYLPRAIFPGGTAMRTALE